MLNNKRKSRAKLTQYHIKLSNIRIYFVYHSLIWKIKNVQHNLKIRSVRNVKICVYFSNGKQTCKKIQKKKE